MFQTDQEIIARINKLRAERNAVILAHNYELGEVQDIADFAGDSLELSQKAAKTKADVIVFCGVKFMAETANLLSPDKTVLLPVAEAGCDMADMADAEGLRQLKAQHPGAIVACYVNSTAEVKAESDICVTSSNAIAMIKSLPEDKEIIFVPDMNLGRYCMEQTGRKMILWEGFCPVHVRITAAQIRRRRTEYPNAQVLMHPESPKESIALADYALSTGGILKHARESNCQEFIIATEIGIMHRLQQENPDKKFIAASEQAVCPAMKVIRLKDILASLENMKTKVVVPEKIAAKARQPIIRMLEETARLQK
ncbi:quinolinate synthase NadA [Lentisphaerota bacterium ZTH]|nr:quinolinate synthase NadA [Lentisphaerota bacterium]WET06172.1 quinolinate synthase NadA [Lentisphaerota bacterium ZTH]